MTPPASTVIAPELCDAVGRLFDRLGTTTVRAEAGWSGFARSCGATVVDRLPADLPEPSVVVIGSTGTVVASIRAYRGEVGFVAPAAATFKPWQRNESWQHDPTMRLWRAGWSTVDVERIIVASDDGDLEYAIGNCRRTPPVSHREVRA